MLILRESSIKINYRGKARGYEGRTFLKAHSKQNIVNENDASYKLQK